MSKIRRVLLPSAIAIYSVTICVADIQSPLGIEVWVLNVPVILMPVLYRSKRLVFVAALACSAMVIVGSVLSPPGSNPLWWDVLNRGMGFATMGLIAVMTIVIIERSNRLDAAVLGLQREVAEHCETRRSLEINEERLRLAIEGASMGTFDVNRQTGRVVCSATHLQLLGYKAKREGEYDIDMWTSWVHPDDMARIQEARDQALRKQSLYSVEYRIIRVDSGEIGWLAVFGCFYYSSTGEAVRFVGVSFDITRRKELEYEVRRKELESAILAITEREQRHIGQDLHDSVGQEMTGLGLMAQTLAQRLPEPGPEQRIAFRLVAGLDQLHRHIRELARGLLPVEVESKGLWAALDDLVARVGEQSGVSVKFDFPEWVDLPDHAASMALYRISQESVSNALRHGRPRTIRLSILSQPNGLRLRIKDDGVGFPKKLEGGKGLGIRIMEHRAESIGGEFRIESSEEGGTVVTVTLPRRKPHDKEQPATAAGQNQDPYRG